MEAGAFAHSSLRTPDASVRRGWCPGNGRQRPPQGGGPAWGAGAARPLPRTGGFRSGLAAATAMVTSTSPIPGKEGQGWRAAGGQAGVSVRWEDREEPGGPRARGGSEGLWPEAGAPGDGATVTTGAGSCCHPVHSPARSVGAPRQPAEHGGPRGGHTLGPGPLPSCHLLDGQAHPWASVASRNRGNDSVGPACGFAGWR